MSTATLNGHRVTHARVHLPAFGIWWAEGSLDEEAELTGAVTLAIADLTLTGTVMSGGPGPKGRSRYRVAGGAGKWGTTLLRRSYANDAGVKAATVVADAARECGETLDVTTAGATRLGPAFARQTAPAARVLEQVFPGGWYVGEDGITRIGKRSAGALTTAVEVGSVDRARGMVELAAESIAAIIPGVIVEGIEAVDVMHELVPGALRSTLWGSGIAATSRRLAAMRRIFEQIDARSRYRGIYEYRVVTRDGERVNLQPIRVSTGMPDLQRVFIRPGIPGARADVMLGARVIVAFLDSEPARPVVIGFEDAEGLGFLPSTLELNASSEVGLGPGPVRFPVARQTDPVQAGPFSGTIVAGSTRVRSG